MTRAGILIVCCLALGARTCGGDKTGEKPAVETTDVVQDLSDPYEVARKALEAYRDRDLGAYTALLLVPPGPDESAETVFKHELVDVDEIQGLFFLDEGKTIAAIIRPAGGDLLAMWFRLVRTKDGFRVEKLLVTDETPPQDVPVEG